MSSQAVHFADISPTSVPSANPAAKRLELIVPMLHTAYDYDERFK
jgi:hypothetical protein